MKIGNGLAGYVLAVAIDPSTPSTLYASTGSNGVFKSTDGGTSWKLILKGIKSKSFSTDSLSVIDLLVIDPTAPGTLYACAMEGIVRSIDGGETWKRIAPEFGLVSYALAIDPSAPDMLYISTSGGVLKSTDGGESWLKVGEGVPLTRVKSLAVGATVYAGTDGRGVFSLSLQKSKIRVEENENVAHHRSSTDPRKPNGRISRCLLSRRRL